MVYFSQAIVLALAVLGTLYKCVREGPDGKPMRSRWGLPVPTRAGVAILTLLGLSTALSVITTERTARETEARRIQAVAAREAAMERLAEVQNQNDALQRTVNRLGAAIDRLRLRDVSARLTYGFLLDLTQVGRPPELFPRGVVLEIVAVRAGHEGAPARDWTGTMLLKQAEMRLKATEQTLDSRTVETVDGPSIEQARIFSGFTGEFGPFALPETWNGALLEARFEVLSQDPWLGKLLQSRRPGDHRDYSDLFQRFYGISTRTVADRSGENGGIQPLPVQVRLELFVDRTLVAVMTGLVVKVSVHDEDVRGLHVVMFPVTRLKDQIFQPAADAERPQRATGGARD